MKFCQSLLDFREVEGVLGLLSHGVNHTITLYPWYPACVYVLPWRRNGVCYKYYLANFTVIPKAKCVIKFTNNFSFVIPILQMSYRLMSNWSVKSAFSPTRLLTNTNIFFFKHLYWSIIALQWCVSFCFTTKWISYTYTIRSHFSSLLHLPPSHPPHPTPLGGHKAPSWSPCAMRLLPTSYLFYIW